RNRRAELSVPPSRKAHVIAVAARPELFDGAEKFFARMASALSLEIAGETPADAQKMASAVTPEAAFYMPMSDLVDLEKEKARLQKELEKAESDVAFETKKLSNPSFVEKAPAAVVEAEREKLRRAEATRDGLLASLKALES
ncbi:MAG: valine--tRNA ligase, partial [Clostridia bacterium]|nr:valine--tRNA ligase [Clostridia bacterium]